MLEGAAKLGEELLNPYAWRLIVEHIIALVIAARPPPRPLQTLKTTASLRNRGL